MVASVVYTSRSGFRGRKCCIHSPLIGFVVLASFHMLAFASVVYNLPARVRRFVITRPLFENDFIS